MKANDLFLITGLILCLVSPPAAGQGTAFTYQGQLSSGGDPATGVYDFQFAIYDAALDGNQQGTVVAVEDVQVNNGLFSTALDFGNVFTAGAQRWLSISVRTNGTGLFTLLEPRQEITPTPYAITAASVRPGAVTGSMIAPGAITSEKIAPGAVKVNHIDDEGERAYATAVQDLEALGLPESISFEKMKPMLSASREPVAMTLSLSSGLTAPVLGFSGEEGISELPLYIAQARIETAIDVEAEIGKRGFVQIARNGRNTFFHGVVTAMTLSGSRDSGSERIYTVRLESPLSALRHRRDYLIWQQKAVPNVLSEILIEMNADFRLKGTYAVKEQLVQFAETDFNFASRLMEEEGIFYFMAHGAEEEEVILGNHVEAFPTIPGTTLPYYGNDPNLTVGRGVEYVTDFKRAARQTTKESVVATHHFEMPGALREGTASGTRGIGQNFEYLHWSGYQPSAVTEAIENLADIRQERNNLEASLMAGESTSPDLRAGYRFDLNDNTSAGVSGGYIVTRVKHAAFARVMKGETTYHYVNDFEAIPAKLPFRPARVTPRPEAHPCTATVVGPAGEKWHADKYGRVKVQFHWDRIGRMDENSSAWVRVVMPMAGAQSGMLFLPEIGDEVLVSFVGGDPNAPVVIGSLYNAARMPPYALPANKSSAGIRLRTGDDSMNEIRFDNKLGAERLAMNTARDAEINAGNDIQITAAQVLGLNAGNELQLSGPVRFSGGTPLRRIQAGQALAGPGAGKSKTVKFDFPIAFTTPPRVVITAEHEPGWNVGDAFVTTVKEVSTTSCTVNIVRIDQDVAWNMDLRLNWMAWE